MHIRTVGAGPPIVLLHGWALHGGVFEPLLQRLHDRYQLHLVDLPGHGGSRDSDLPLALQPCVDEIAARTPDAVWLGWSLGGLFALKAAAMLPQVRGLVMLASTPRFVQGPDWPDAVEATVFAQFARDLEQDYRGTLDRFLALDALGSEHARAELRRLRAALHAGGEPAPRALQQGLQLLARSDLRHLLPGLPVPSLWISGRRDRLVPAAGMQAAAASAPASGFLDLPRGGHAPFLGQADEVAARLADFVGGLPA
ncbi:pimeloyl-[acyl-carrier protein] methyl ester esterase [Pseudoxanthomonas kalamensis DSM 18571]|uniref:pimeloyl-ACP methyl ester esterase BioH n=1 Tax=Pseudoxanthomonas kalamensis TaxID=289483 RepID=UPI0013920317|nr:pimeloyl-ACP methyl ester esterase BioH [Pseudoxanthomonas kalamensis]KAF1712685.1 pimeloyl-[acyl-carrier protein] methyl ester esterase [Pseudoxanthomonas kalamensis DSM 18571]